MTLLFVNRAPWVFGLDQTAGRLVAAVLASSLSTAALANVTESDDLAELSLEALSNTRVTSVSKRAELASDAAASIYVLTAESIRRAGVTTLPEALRLAPNLQVARVDARNYAITARGFNTTLENKLLVLIDGRSVYSPLFSGVYWDAQDVVMDDIERIEVISGAGATLWGANAVNGVINIITKSAKASSGQLARISSDGSFKSGAVRLAGDVGNTGSYRVYAKAVKQDDLTREVGTPSLTGMSRTQGGFRADWGTSADALTIQGDVYSGQLHQQGTANIKIGGANVLGRKNVRLDSGTELTAQAYWDFTERDQPNAFNEHLNTLDVQFQSAMPIGQRNMMVAGIGYRRAFDRIVNANSFAFLPGKLDLHWANAFVQNETSITPDWRLIVGLKLEDNNYTGLEVLPTLRMAWKPSSTASVWAAASRTVRAPSRIDRDLYSPTRPPLLNGVPQYGIAGGPGFVSEVANVAELGYRAQPTQRLSFSATGFVSDYSRLRTLEPNPAGAGQVFANKARGRTRGLELWGEWQASPAWRLAGGAVLQRVETTLDPDSKDASAGVGIATSDPSNYWNIRSSWDIARNHSIDLRLRHSGALERPAVPAYNALDMTYIWQATPQWSVSVVGRNLLDASHVEFGGPAGRTAFERQVGVSIAWRP